MPFSGVASTIFVAFVGAVVLLLLMRLVGRVSGRGSEGPANEGDTMTNWKLGLAVALSSLGISALAAPPAQAAVIIIHAGRDEPPPARQERLVVRRGYVWDSGHYGWRHHRYVWTRGRYVHARRGHKWAPGRWERHDDHYDWHNGEWHAHR